MTKSDPLRFTLFFIWKTEEGGRARHPFDFLLIQLLLCLMVFLPLIRKFPTNESNAAYANAAYANEANANANEADADAD